MTILEPFFNRFFDGFIKRLTDPVIPTDIEGLEFWYDVTDFDSLFFGQGGIAQINDKSGNGFHAIQGISANQPAYQDTGLNGKPTAAGLGSRFMTTSGYTADPIVGSTFCIFRTAIILGTNEGIYGAEDTDTSRIHQTGARIVYGAGSSGTLTGSIPVTSGTTYTSEYHSSSGNLLAILNGAEDVNAAATFSSPQAAEWRFLGVGNSAGIGAFSGSMTSLFRFNRVLVGDELTAMRKFQEELIA